MLREAREVVVFPEESGERPIYISHVKKSAVKVNSSRPVLAADPREKTKDRSPEQARTSVKHEVLAKLEWDRSAVRVRRPDSSSRKIQGIMIGRS
jgi:hypothetical protein